MSNGCRKSHAEKTYKAKNCLRCGQEFLPAFPRRMYCSDKCRRGEGTCSVCGANFIKKGNTTGKYCSQECWYKDYDSKNDRPCPRCGKVFGAAIDQKYCSVECAHDSFRVDKKCRHCGETFRTAVAGNRKYCSRRCAVAERMRRGYVVPDGTERMAGNGYVLVKNHGKWVGQHRLVMEQILGRSLESSEHVHHKNGRRADNSPENLELWKGQHPKGVRATDYHCPGCRCHEHESKYDAGGSGI